MVGIILSVILAVLLTVAGVYTLTLHDRLRHLQTDLNVQKARSARQVEAQCQTLKRQLTDQQVIFTTLADAAYDAVIVIDPQRHIVMLNQSARTLFPHDSPIGDDLATVTGIPELEMIVNDALINEEEEFEEQIIIHERNYRVRARFYRQDTHQYVGLALSDITKLVRLNRARRDMVANISHELRTPIANIRLHIDGLFHDQDKPKRKDSIHTLRAIAKETDNLLWLVQEMSDLSMIESGQSIVRLIDHSLMDLVDEAIDRMAERAESHDVQLVRHIPEKLRVLCDRDLIQRVFVNLIHNALKWSPEGEAVTINATYSDDEVTISVLDNGPGVPPDVVSRIFERFFQVDISRTGGDGSGLGLAICRHIVEAHGGRVWAESNANGAGGRFRFTLLSAGPVNEDDLPEMAELVQADDPAEDETTEEETAEEKTEEEAQS
jgi:two-component system, OmpR family, phosphate regulon sensor histidine kinase PhoR